MLPNTARLAALLGAALWLLPGCPTTSDDDTAARSATARTPQRASTAAISGTSSAFAASNAGEAEPGRSD